MAVVVSPAVGSTGVSMAARMYSGVWRRPVMRGRQEMAHLPGAGFEGCQFPLPVVQTAPD